MPTTTTNPLLAQVAGQASRRGLILRVPSPESLLGAIDAWLLAEYPDVVRSTRLATATGDPGLSVDLHPAARALVVTAAESGRVLVTAETEAVGPGYHRFVGRLIERMGLDLAITWDRGGPDRGDPADETAGSTFAERPAAERAYLLWLGRSLKAARTTRSASGGGTQIGIPDGIRYTFAGAIATVLGPRDDAWLERALADTRVAIDVTPWWADASDSASLLNRALSLMWLEVRWRTPALPEEGLLFDEVHRLLSKAFPLDPTLPYPWRAWHEVARLRGIDDAMARQVAERAAREPASEPPIGYRRDPVTVHHEGWALEIPGHFAERRTPEEWWGGGQGRNITLAAVRTGSSVGAMAAEAFVRQFAGDLGPGAIDHRAGGVMGRAKVSTDTSSGVEVGVLEGYSAVVGSGAAIRVVFDDPADWQWALETWKSLAPG